MSDLKEAREKVRQLLLKCRHRVSSYEVNELLGHSTFQGGKLSDMKPEHWHEDEVLISVKIRSSPLNTFPSQQYSNTYFRNYTGIAINDRQKAIENLYSNIKKDVPELLAAIREDDAYASTIGYEVRVLRKIKQNHVLLLQGKIGVVVKHSPAFLVIKFDDEITVPIATWKFTTAYEHYVDADGTPTDTQCKPGRGLVSGFSPYLEFVNGYKPWLARLKNALKEEIK